MELFAFSRIHFSDAHLCNGRIIHFFTNSSRSSQNKFKMIRTFTYFYYDIIVICLLILCNSHVCLIVHLNITSLYRNLLCNKINARVLDYICALFCDVEGISTRPVCIFEEYPDTDKLGFGTRITHRKNTSRQRKLAFAPNPAWNLFF